MTENIPTDRIDIQHHIQRQILVQLRQGGSAAYKQLKPDGVEGNAFNYHLRNLKKSGLVDLEDGKYSLTPTGFLVVDAYSLESQRLMLRPHLYSVLLVTTGEQVLLYEHVRPPLSAQLSLLSGKLHYGDTFQDGVAREARRRQLSDDYSPRVVCPFNVRYVKKGEVVLHRAGTLWHLDYKGPLARRDTLNGKSQWVQFDDLIDMSNCLPEVFEGLERLRTGNREPIDISCEI